MSHLILYLEDGAMEEGAQLPRPCCRGSDVSCSSVRCVGMELLCSQSYITAFMSGSRR